MKKYPNTTIRKPCPDFRGTTARRIRMAAVFVAFVSIASASGQTVRSAGSSAVADTSFHYREALTIISVIEKDTKRTKTAAEEDTRWVGWSINTMLGLLTLFTAYAFFSLRSVPDTEESETFAATPRKSSENRADPEVIGKSNDSRAHHPDQVRESSLQEQRDVHAKKIARLLQRL